MLCFFEFFLIKAYRLEPLILKHYSNISPVQIHWYNTSNPLPYEHMKPSFLHPAKEPTSVSENEGISTVPSPVTSPVLSRRHYGESITNIGKASILGNFSSVFLINEYKHFLYRHLTFGYLGILYVLQNVQQLIHVFRVNYLLTDRI